MEILTLLVSAFLISTTNAQQAGRIWNFFTGHCIDVHNSIDDQSHVVTSVCSEDDNHLVYFIPYDQHYYKIQSKLSGFCFFIEGGIQNNNAELLQGPCSTEPNYLFKLSGHDNYRYIIPKHSQITDKCLRVGRKTAIGRHVVQATCGAGRNQDHWLTDAELMASDSSVEVGYPGKLVSKWNTNLCAGTVSGSLDSGADMNVQNCLDDLWQEFVFVREGDFFFIRNDNSDKCLQATVGGNVIQSNCALHNQMLWSTEGNSDSMQIINYEYGQCLKPGGTTANSNLEIGECGADIVDDWEVSAEIPVPLTDDILASPPGMIVTLSPSDTPTKSPTKAPTGMPTMDDDIMGSPPATVATPPPSLAPTDAPVTAAPSDAPSPLDSGMPSSAPVTANPSSAPSVADSGIPSAAPVTAAPSSVPSQAESGVPSGAPVTSAPSNTPSQADSGVPSAAPVTVAPSSVPSQAESGIPSGAPVTAAPSNTPSQAESGVPSAAPVTAAPSSVPSQAESGIPSGAPVTAAPSNIPSRAESGVPSAAPVTAAPSSVPSQAESGIPSGAPVAAAPSNIPSQAESGIPSATPVTAVPSSGPSAFESGIPSGAPVTGVPSNIPSQAESGIPSAAPVTAVPSSGPSAFESGIPSGAPVTAAPSNAPSQAESGIPSATPVTAVPSSGPSAFESGIPSGAPVTTAPSNVPSQADSGIPSATPVTAAPSSSPSAQESGMPSGAPVTAVPSSAPSEMPTFATDDDVFLSPPSSAASATEAPTATDNPTSAPHMNSAFSPVYNMDITAAAAANLPNGKIITWSSYTKLQFGKFQGLTWVSLLDPFTHEYNTSLVDTGHDMFCPGTATLPDGRIMVTGGSKAEPTTFYNPDIDVWVRGQDMTIPRGYQSMTFLSDGSVFTVGGSWTDGRPGVGFKYGEIWHPTTSKWEVNWNLPAELMLTDDKDGVYRQDNHMWIFQAPDGNVFQAGPSKQMHWVDVFNQDTGTITDSLTRQENVDAMTGIALMFDIGKLLTFGGTPDYRNGIATAHTHVIELNGGRGQETVRQVANMAHARCNANGVVLPNGQVIVVGGQGRSRLFTDLDSKLPVELWDPATEVWTELASLAVPRNYHSVALLMKDGRVWAGGGGLCGDCVTPRTTISANHPDYEIFTPPYLLTSGGWEATRPVILSSPERIMPNDVTIEVTVDTTEDHTFSLMRLGGVTHATNTDNRRVPLEVLNKQGTKYTLNIPTNRNVALPGIYFLFAMNYDGVPSIAESIIIETDDPSHMIPPVVAQIQSSLSDLCVNVVDPLTQEVEQEVCHTNSSYYYTFEPVASEYRIRSGSTGKCLQVLSGNTTEGALVVQGVCSDQSHALWTFSGTGDQQLIMASHSSLCLTIEEGSMNTGALMVQDVCTQTSSTRDKWKIHDRLTT